MSKHWRLFFWAFILFNMITSLFDAAVIFPQCTPVEYNWNKSIDGHCWSNIAINAIGIAQWGMTDFVLNFRHSNVWTIGIAAATDFVLSVLPLVFLWRVNIIWRVKIRVCAIMGLRFAYFHETWPSRMFDSDMNLIPQEWCFCSCANCFGSQSHCHKDPTCMLFRINWLNYYFRISRCVYRGLDTTF